MPDWTTGASGADSRARAEISSSQRTYLVLATALRADTEAPLASVKLPELESGLSSLSSVEVRK